MLMYKLGQWTPRPLGRFSSIEGVPRRRGKMKRRMHYSELYDFFKLMLIKTLRPIFNLRKFEAYLHERCVYYCVELVAQLNWIHTPVEIDNNETWTSDRPLPAVLPSIVPQPAADGWALRLGPVEVVQTGLFDSETSGPQSRFLMCPTSGPLAESNPVKSEWVQRARPTMAPLIRSCYMAARVSLRRTSQRKDIIWIRFYVDAVVFELLKIIVLEKTLAFYN